MQNQITKAIFGFKDQETGEQLRVFFKKHTGRDVDFNGIKHYKDGFKLLLFSIPLNTIDVIGISTSNSVSTDVKKFRELNEFIEWYEKKYGKGTKSNENNSSDAFEESFIKQYEELNIKSENKFDPFPFINKFTPLEPLVRGEDSLTVALYNGLYARIPVKSFRKHMLVLNTNIFINQKHRNWEDFLDFLGYKEAEYWEIEIRFTPDNSCITYNKKYDEDVEYICNYINYRLNREKPLKYPDSWFEVAKLIIPKVGAPITINGDILVEYMFAAPRSYFKYFKEGKTVEEIADDIYYDNV